MHVTPHYKYPLLHQQVFVYCLQQTEVVLKETY